MIQQPHLSQGTLSLDFQPPFNWQHLLDFYRKRAIEGIEVITQSGYARSFVLGQSTGWFKAAPTSGDALLVEYKMHGPDADARKQDLIISIRRLFDLDADITAIETHLKQTAIAPILSTGLRIPGVWSPWEAGIRAIFGQQISITAAITLLNSFVRSLNPSPSKRLYFPTPTEVAQADFNTLKMPQSRKETLQRFAHYMLEHYEAAPDDWIKLKGIGPWTISYAKLRGLSDPDCFLSTDLVIKKAVQHVIETTPGTDANTLNDEVSPWGSYATFNCWNATL